MNNRSIYANPYKYACVCNIPYDLAKIACLKQRHYDKTMRKNRPYCPKCGSKNIDYEMGSYEEGYGDFCECDECGETFEPHEVPNYEYFDIFGSDFDVVLFFSKTEDVKQGWIEACGAKTLEEWQEFAKKIIIGNRC